jgi:hypothetical protein
VELAKPEELIPSPLSSPQKPSKLVMVLVPSWQQVSPEDRNSTDLPGNTNDVKQFW